MDYSNIHLPLIILMAIFFLIKARKKIERYYFLLLIYLVVNLLVESFANVLDYNKKSNIALYNFGMIFEITVFLLIYYREMHWKIIIKSAILLFLIFAWINALFFQNLHSFYSNTYTVGSILLMSFSLYYLFGIVVKNETINPLFNFMFWFSIGVLFCYLGNLPYLSILNKLLSADNKVLIRNLALISLVVNTLLYILIIIGSLCHRKMTESET